MGVTLVELKAKLADMEETYLLELLQLKSQDLVDRFEDIIEDKFEDLASEIEELGTSDTGEFDDDTDVRSEG